ncbi:hypothetical protein RJ639_023474, partial [Escallonia herrerae]
KLFLNNNSLTGEIPAKLTGCSNLISSVAHRNKLPGNIPVELASLSKLGHFSAELNNLTGSIPLSFGNLSSLVHLSIGKISLTRSIPGTLGQLRTLPESFSNLSSNLAFLYLDNNPISGGIPAGIGNLVNLKYLAMWNTQLSKLKDLILSHSQLSGVIPSTIGNLSSLIELYLDGNNFDGNIPSTLGNCTNLLLLNLSQNSLSGRIPQQLFGLSSLSILLDLSQNHLSGTLPSEIGESTNLGYLDVSNNKLQGNIPTGLANCLRLENFFWTSWYDDTVHTTTTFLFSKKKTSHFAFAEGLIKATEGFSSMNLIGIGSFGSVYRGIIDDGKLVAVKVLNLQHRGASKSFMAECEALKITRHRNLVKVLTACSSVDNQETAVVYEFMDAMAACAEYGMGSKVSVHGDVYCFGILLLEMFTKKRPTDDMFSGNMNLHNFAKTAFSEGLLGIADPTLLQEGEEGETSTGTSIAHTQPVVCREEIHDCMTSVCKSHSNVERVEY